MSEKNNNGLEKIGTKVVGFFESVGAFLKNIPNKLRSIKNSKGSSSSKYKSKKSSRRKGKIRYDRLGVLAAAVIVLIVLIVVLIKAIVASTKDDTKDDKNKDKPSDNSVSVSDTSQSTSDSQGDFEVAYAESEIAYEQIKYGDLIAVNSVYEYAFPTAAQDILANVMENKNSSYAVSNANILLDANAIKQLNSMMEAFCTETGKSDIELKQGYRTKEYQQELHNSGSSVLPGYTEHHTGLAINISIIVGGDYKKYDYNDLPGDEYKWIYEHCAEYGFVPRYTLDKELVTGCEVESDHFRYVGVPHAYYMTKNNLCLEEYLEELKQYTFDNPLTFTCEYNSKNYVVYYTAASVAVGVDDKTNVFIPQNAEYTLSGDNMGGFIVTVIQ